MIHILSCPPVTWLMISADVPGQGYLLFLCLIKKVLDIYTAQLQLNIHIFLLSFKMYFDYLQYRHSSWVLSTVSKSWTPMLATVWVPCPCGLMVVYEISPPLNLERRYITCTEWNQHYIKKQNWSKHKCPLYNPSCGEQNVQKWCPILFVHWYTHCNPPFHCSGHLSLLMDTSVYQSTNYTAWFLGYWILDPSD